MKKIDIMIKLRTIIICFLLLSMLPFSFSQHLKLEKAPEFRVDPGVSEENIEQVMKTLEIALNEYARAAKLLDNVEKRVTEKSINRFNKLFSAGAKVQKDYAEYIPGELIIFKDYSLEVYNTMQLKGVEVKVQRIELMEIKSTNLGFFVPMVKVTKQQYNILTANGDLELLPQGRLIVQKIIFDIYKEDPTRADITEIRPYRGIPPADDYIRLISISAGVGSSVYSTTTSTYWNDSFSESIFNVKGGLDFSIGAEFFTNRFITGKASTNRKLAFSGGLRFASYQIKTEVLGFAIPKFEQRATLVDNGDTLTQGYMRIVNSLNAEENMRIGVLEVPLGIAFAIQKKQKSLIYLHARFIPSFVISGGGSITGKGTYDGILIDEDPNSSGYLTESTYRILRTNASKEDLYDKDGGYAPYHIGIDKDLDFDVAPELTGISFAVQLSPTYYMKFSDDNPGWGLMVGLDLSYHLGSFVKHDPVSSVLNNVFKYDDDFNGSLLNHYTDKVSPFSFGLRVGLFHRLDVEP